MVNDPCKSFKSAFKEEGVDSGIDKKLNPASPALIDLQMKAFRGLRNEKLDSREVENFLDGMAEEIA
jgi:hypothetical protein